MKKVLLVILWVVVLWAIAYLAWPTDEEVIVTEPEAEVVTGDVSTIPGTIEEEISTGEVEKL